MKRNNRRFKTNNRKGEGLVFFSFFIRERKTILTVLLLVLLLVSTLRNTSSSIIYKYNKRNKILRVFLTVLLEGVPPVLLVYTISII